MAQEKFQEYNSHTFPFMKNILIVLADGIRVSGDRIRLLADAIRMRTERENVGKGRGKCLERVGRMLYLCGVNEAISRSEAFFDNLRPLKKIV